MPEMPPIRKFQMKERAKSIARGHPEAPTPERAKRHQEHQPSRDGDHLGGRHVERANLRRPAGDELMVRPDEEAQHHHAHDAQYGGLVAKERLATKDHEDIDHDAKGRQDDQIDLRMAEEPEQVLRQPGVATARARRESPPT